ncbi:S-adenosylmethionine decarboxylase proenzyme [Capsicum baccatum]|uniref:S-adenosylmethionine decarboxylase proenzyme n=1 Tax=Capsicum baccatum TaxID=33114 RepID=A0A2G2VVE1_CAPBA|nr:S-adenosylmethionine decarboxylase proenzyme [Capsicum baccatum]
MDSYASFEAVGYDFREVNLTAMIERVLSCIRTDDYAVTLLRRNFILSLAWTLPDLEKRLLKYLVREDQ